MREAQRGVAECGAELEDSLGIGGSGQCAEQRTVRMGIGAAAMLRAMRQRRRTDVHEWINRFLLSHGK
jgi:hypothetical protein